jgi:cysteinyl-tRNA synthetase
MLKIYNTLSKKKEEFKPLNPPEVKMYTCGVTVYDSCHIGHCRSLYIFEVIRRYLQYKGFKVRFVRNITDVDDKIIDRAGKLSQEKNISLIEAFNEVRETYIDSYYQDLKLVGIPPADVEPKATENIEEMKRFIQKLIDKGFAYQVEGNVYFRLRKAKGYGQLSGRKVDDLFSAVRIEPDPLKEDPLDFALWKRSKPSEPKWQSPWGAGRPGWHIECSVMSLKHLGVQTLDIHGGGRDLIFPHHENEIAQSEAFTGKPFAKFWIHHGLLTINGQKMAKSLGNFVTIKDVLSKYPTDVLKLFYLQTHYSQPIDFSWEVMEGKRNALERIMIFLKAVKERECRRGFPIEANHEKTVSGKELKDEIKKAQIEFEEAMDDDFNTPGAVAALFEIVRICNKVLHDVTYNEKEHLIALEYAKQTIQKLGGILGLSFKESPPRLPEEEIKTLVEMRERLRKQKRFKEADRIRRELEEKGIILEDLKDGTTWRQKL